MDQDKRVVDFCIRLLDTAAAKLFVTDCDHEQDRGAQASLDKLNGSMLLE